MKFLQNNTSMVIPDISDVLEQVDRQMLLILKTNDLIRGIESALRTQNRMTAFWVMSKCCVHSSYSEKKSLVPEKSRSQQLGLALREKWDIFKLNILYLFLGLRNFGFFAALKQML